MLFMYYKEIPGTHHRLILLIGENIIEFIVHVNVYMVHTGP